jgi:glycine/D-amino acid oxidase-like deaminating enzyme
MMRELRRERRVAVLGAGILGSCVALMLARRGVRVTLFDAAARPMSRASRWNEGKIHLGYLYAGDHSLATARKLLPGGIAFQPLIEALIGTSLEPQLTAGDIFLTHARSVVDADSTLRYLNSVWVLVSQSRSGDHKPQPLSQADLAQITPNPEIVAGFRIAERSVNAGWLADRLAERVLSESRIDVRCNSSVASVARDSKGDWELLAAGKVLGGFDAVVNALWEGRTVIDAAIDPSLMSPLSYRYRVGVFLRLSKPMMLNATITTGPFGDMKSYHGGDMFLSWYPAGLVLDCQAAHAPPTPKLDPTRQIQIYESTIRALTDFFPVLTGISLLAENWVVRGGWIVAHGGGLLSDPNATLHHRYNFGIARKEGYYSVDTGKYSVAPWLANQIAGELTA